MFSRPTGSKLEPLPPSSIFSSASWLSNALLFLLAGEALFLGMPSFPLLVTFFGAHHVEDLPTKVQYFRKEELPRSNSTISSGRH